MDILLYLGLFVVSLVVLLKASDVFVDAAESVGLSMGISPFIVGLTIVAFGTSLPELATSIAAVIGGESEIVVSNVVGSNITNIALVLGLVAVLVDRIELEYNIWHIDMPHLWGSAFLLWFVLQDYRLSFFESCLLLFGIVIFLAYSFKEDNEDEQNTIEKIKIHWTTYLKMVLGGVFVWLSADYTIHAIQKLSQIASIPPEIIGLSAVSLGTSLPEVIVSLTAARRGKTGIAVGNVLGSNIFNTYVVMSIPAFFGPLHIPATINDFFLPMMIAMTILFGVMSNNRKISRWEGMILIIFYILFLGELFDEVLY